MGNWGYGNLDSDEAVEFYDNFYEGVLNEVRRYLMESPGHVIPLEIEIPPRLEILIALKKHVGFRVASDYLVDLEDRYIQILMALAAEDGWAPEHVDGRIQAIRSYFEDLRSNR